MLPGDLFFKYCMKRAMDNKGDVRTFYILEQDCLTILTSKYFSNTKLRIIVKPSTLFKDDKKNKKKTKVMMRTRMI